MTLRLRRFIGQFALSALFLMILLGQVGRLYDLYFIDRFEAALYDLKIQLFRAQGMDERIAIVDIDEKSLREVGRWPWPRERTAALAAALYEQYGVAAIGFDVVFSEPDQSSGLPVLERLARGELAGETGFRDMLQRIRPRLDYDAVLAGSLAGGQTVLGYYFGFAGDQERVGRLPAPVMSCASLKAQGVGPMRAAGYHANLPPLQARAASAGFFNAHPDFDGVMRGMPMLIELGGECYGSLALMTTQAAMGSERIVLRPADGLRPPALDMDGLRVPLDERGQARVPYRAPGAYQYISAADVLRGAAPAAQLEGRVVLIGSTAPGIMDLRVTPTDKAFPGVEIHASLISGILDGTLPWEPVGVQRYEAMLVLGLGLLLAAALPYLAPLWAALLTLVLSVLLVAGDLYTWSALHMQVPLATSLLTVIGLFVLNMTYGFFVEARSKAQITSLFGQYVPPELVDEMAKDPGRYSLRGESRVMTVLFSDIRDFTSISEGLEASQLADMLNAYLSHMTRLVQERRGTIDKYIGDAIMAFWGAPMSDDRHASDGVLTALAMQASLAELNPVLEQRGWPAVRIGVGVNTGRMSVGNMGSRFRMSYTVMADAVNLASRLEGLTKQYGVGVLAGEATREACPEFAFMLVDRVRVKGKDRPVAIYEPLGVAAELPADRLAEAQAFEAAVADYQAGRWDAAEAALRGLRQRNPRKLYDVYLERIGHFRADPPPEGWDGVFTFTTK
ncbi:MAG: adenylate/guanylate cyclase domain-containing protein [Thiobacillaceae bacterium]|jgi:adenylate cyclase|nr:adenylate/guanylate cyclase domain-containing protein [Thiobacillaceae bacterium]